MTLWEQSRDCILNKVRAAELAGVDIDIRTGDIHKELHFNELKGGRRPDVCKGLDAVRAIYPDHKVLAQPPKGQGANYIVRFHFFKK